MKKKNLFIVVSIFLALFDNDFTIFVKPIDMNGNISDVDYLSIKINEINVTEFSGVINNLDGKYTKKFLIPKQNITEFKVNVFAQQFEKTINITETFQIVDGKLIDNVKEEAPKYYELIKLWVGRNWIVLLMVVTLLLLILMTIRLKVR